MRYSLEREKGKSFNAGSKAVRDVSAILHRNGFLPLVYDPICERRWLHNLKRIWRVFSLLFVIKKDDVCFLQWPIYIKIRIDKLLLMVLRLRCRHLHILVHDLTSIRIEQNAAIEKKYMLQAETVIVHTPAMKELLISWGVDERRLKILTSFDYLISDKNTPQRKLSKEIVFAGNLEKSGFLYELTKHPIDVSINCYGKEVAGLTKPLIYKGRFDSDYVSGIEGSWGLVWDGDGIDTCSGLLGEYLRINSPHKVSLYIVSRLPIIIWKEAALAEYVKNKNIGFVIGSLQDIPAVLSKVTECEYKQILSNVDKERIKLINGEHLKELL